jgi:hypothetical protein
MQTGCYEEKGDVSQGHRVHKADKTGSEAEAVRINALLITDYLGLTANHRQSLITNHLLLRQLRR